MSTTERVHKKTGIYCLKGVFYLNGGAAYIIGHINVKAKSAAQAIAAANKRLDEVEAGSGTPFPRPVSWQDNDEAAARLDCRVSERVESASFLDPQRVAEAEAFA